MLHLTLQYTRGHYEFTSIAWAYDAQGPVKGVIKPIVMQRDQQCNLLCYKVDKEIRDHAPAHIKAVLKNIWEYHMMPNLITQKERKN